MLFVDMCRQSHARSLVVYSAPMRLSVLDNPFMCSHLLWFMCTHVTVSVGQPFNVFPSPLVYENRFCASLLVIPGNCLSCLTVVRCMSYIWEVTNIHNHALIRISATQHLGSSHFELYACKMIRTSQCATYMAESV